MSVERKTSFYDSKNIQLSLKCEIGIAHDGQLFAAKYLKSGAAMLINDVEYFSHIVSASRRRWILIWKLESSV